MSSLLSSVVVDGVDGNSASVSGVLGVEAPVGATANTLSFFPRLFGAAPVRDVDPDVLVPDEPPCS